MTRDAPSPTGRLDLDAARLVAEHPPAWTHPNKRVVYEAACPPASAHGGTLHVSQWAACPLPESFRPSAASALIEPRPDVFAYEPAAEGTVAWHVNFADPKLFGFYGGALFAQDELQVAEHPALGALRERLDAQPWDGVTGRTVGVHGPTPVLVRGVERRCRIDTADLYGNAFARASAEEIREATEPLDPPTVSNLIAMAAPGGGYGPYRVGEIERVLVTAFTAFSAAVAESGLDDAVVHSGYWGCGAFGGDPVLMVLLQALAAEAAGVSRLVVHTVDEDGLAPVTEAARLLHDLTSDSSPDAVPTSNLLAQVDALGFVWGQSNGT